MKPIKVMSIFGTRPEAIKMAPIILLMQQHLNQFQPITVVTAQHREMLDQVLEVFHINPDYDLNIMKQGQTLSDITTRVITELDPIIEKANPDIILVHGDTTTTFAASISAFYHQIKVGHVEAGLRTWNKLSPYPEEMNRQLTDVLADLYFAPTQLSRNNLLKENHPDKNIYVTGNTAIDALKQTVTADYQHSVFDELNQNSKMILLTMHRRENQGDPMRRTFEAIKEVLASHPDVEVVYPVHLSPAVQKVAHEVFDGVKAVHLIEPLDVLDFHNMSARSFFIMTDSGGVQEEAPSLKKPVLVLRDTTERPEGIKAGTLRLVGTDPKVIKREMERLLDDPKEYQRMAEAKNPYGDGNASLRILNAIQQQFNHSSI
ncbi:UDP-N-acetylglucosamine 2-epimerase [Lentilactobacillus parabuchneri]|jgi:UDP-N-acetylglucosamine 2-epimerase (non-hydrolysing)|uniref:UDP-N-acetylglucosamine 2-epimerase (non-hydrolyzing) n=3 Tax=Lentilactobacillus TaxID=2767893 RepID=A0A1X1FDP3_9LACO|nr:UDP-N-acetylglucosamine 2-epimerase (non-hydrolyzing) [Lentilactobacillus parabuchneri]APR07949.1 UDP-N-acetylglucosamine 2-epimerase [Lentilactobacillus parabuchneri]KRM47190.1 UDP-N-acetylglucosamine 2-epimerase [Lentilactobacillus parabuchneri DSM 5707 = NBRC 107865]KRN70952.1 UDP-N-acetylglucosamine 2-epimerase [Lentilactobacillus parabuchneri]MBW0222080.1 UDP-N-acetylglucosamine 2-epimerase (non-hydrolyzing) [Lentilactobacillus parabuchneri]MBW0245683.1 UDP-N-acetylglucosamine 2-epimer